MNSNIAITTTPPIAMEPITTLSPELVAGAALTYVPKLPGTNIALIRSGEIVALGVDEVIDYVADVYNFAEFLYGRFRDGVQPLTDGAALLSQQAQIMEFITDWPLFLEQSKDIEGNEPTEIVNGIVARLNVNQDQARLIFVDAIRFGAATWEGVNAGRTLAAHFFNKAD